jgi:hypothetical protein
MAGPVGFGWTGLATVGLGVPWLAPVGPSWPQLALVVSVGPSWPRLALVGPSWPNNMQIIEVAKYTQCCVRYGLGVSNAVTSCV